VAEVTLPAVHDCPGPQDVPAGLLALATQTEVPDAHDVVPVLHALVGWHATPAVHASQFPALQTMLLPHDTPSASGTFVSEHTGVPVEQFNEPA
jgi:hypothetical protein